MEFSRAKIMEWVAIAFLQRVLTREFPVCAHHWQDATAEPLAWTQPFLLALLNFHNASDIKIFRLRDKDRGFDPVRMPWKRNGNPVQYSCVENSHGRRSLGYSHGVAKGRNTEATFHFIRIRINSHFLMKQYWQGYRLQIESIKHLFLRICSECNFPSNLINLFEEANFTFETL